MLSAKAPLALAGGVSPTGVRPRLDCVLSERLRGRAGALSLAWDQQLRNLKSRPWTFRLVGILSLCDDKALRVSGVSSLAGGLHFGGKCPDRQVG
jgi:hypothetical protein